MLEHGSHVPPPRNVRTTGGGWDVSNAIGVGIVQATFDELKPGYKSWLKWQSLQDPDISLGMVGFVLKHFALREAHPSITAPSTGTLRWVLEYLAELFPEALPDAKQKMLGFLEFLDESDEFTGSDQQFEDLYELLDDDMAPGSHELPRPVVQQPDSLTSSPKPPASPPAPPRVEVGNLVLASSMGERETLTALEWLPLTIRARAFLGWIGRGKEITGGGVLRRKDFKEAAATLGQDALGVPRDRTDGSWIPGVSGTWKAMSMWDVPSLELYWQMLRSAGLIENAVVRLTIHKSEYRVVATRAGTAFLERDPRTTVEAVPNMASAGYRFLTGLMPRSDGSHSDNSRSAAQVLIAAATEEPMPTHLVAQVPDGASAVSVDETTGRAYPRIGERVHHWGSQGLVDLGDTITIPRVLRPALSTALAEPFHLQVESSRVPEQAQDQLPIAGIEVETVRSRTGKR